MQYINPFRPLDSNQADNPDGVPPARRCPDAAAHVPDCIETDYDRRGDCEGTTHGVVLLVNHAETAAGETGWMCNSHARQAVRKHEAKLTGDMVPLPT